MRSDPMALPTHMYYPSVLQYVAAYVVMFSAVAKESEASGSCTCTNVHIVIGLAKQILNFGLSF